MGSFKDIYDKKNSEYDFDKLRELQNILCSNIPGYNPVVSCSDYKTSECPMSCHYALKKQKIENIVSKFSNWFKPKRILK